MQAASGEERRSLGTWRIVGCTPKGRVPGSRLEILLSGTTVHIAGENGWTTEARITDTIARLEGQKRVDFMIGDMVDRQLLHVRYALTLESAGALEAQRLVDVIAAGRAAVRTGAPAMQLDPSRIAAPVSGTALAAAGLPDLFEGDGCVIDFGGERITLWYGAAPHPIEYAEVSALKVGGRGVHTTTTGGGWIGGGFGAAGIIEGALVASAMNALTTRSQTTTETLVELSAGPRALMILNETEVPDRLRVHLAPVFDRIEQARAAAALRVAGGARGSVELRLAQLKQLGELRDAGVLTDAEFQAEKARILAS